MFYWIGGLRLVIKIIFSTIIITSTALIGYISSHRYVLRLQQLKNLYIAFQLLETEILYATNPLPLAMKRTGEKSSKVIGNIFLDTYKIFKRKEGHSVEEAWNMAIDGQFHKTALKEEDKDILVDFGKNLGGTDKENQVKNFQWVYIQLEKQQQLAEQLRMKNGKLHKSLGLLVGMAIVIVFI